MNNTFIRELEDRFNYKFTENGAVAMKSTGSKVYDLFALGGAYRDREPADQILLFKEAFEEDRDLALKCLFYLRDVRGGQGERSFFRNCFHWLAIEHIGTASTLLPYVVEYGRWDDLWGLLDTNLGYKIMDMVKDQLSLDIAYAIGNNNAKISLLAKWLPSENTSSYNTRKLGRKIRGALNLSAKEYRQLLSKLRTRINIVEKQLSSKNWDAIEFDKIPAKAGLNYKNAFINHCGERYLDFINNKTSKVNAKTLYPYEIVEKVPYSPVALDRDREILNKYWENLPDYFEGKPCNLICVVDTSGSMAGRPISVATSLGIYAAERNRGPFKDCFISFASVPQLIKVKGIDFCDKVNRIRRTYLIDNTNLEAVFNLLLNIAINKNVKIEDIPQNVVIISDMEIDEAVGEYDCDNDEHINTMSRIKKKWDKHNIPMPKLTYWNVAARNDTILDIGPNISLVSGCSPIIFKMVATGKTGVELMLETLLSDRYKKIKDYWVF